MSKMIIRIVLLTIFLIMAGFFISGPIFTNSEIKEKVELLNSDKGENRTNPNFSSKEFLSSPLIVQKYLKNSLDNSTNINQTTHLKLIGETRTESNSEWVSTEVELYYSLSTPAFIWVATADHMPLLWNKTINTFINKAARSETKFLSSITTEETIGVKLDQSYFLFYILNSVFSPVVVFPNQNTQWKSLGKLEAEVMIWDKSESGTVVFYFNESGTVQKVETEDMFIPNLIEAKKGKFTLHLANFKETDGYTIPTYLEYQWNLSGGDFTFARFNITVVEHN